MNEEGKRITPFTLPAIHSISSIPFTELDEMSWIHGIVHSVLLKYSRSNGPESLHFIQFTSCNWVEMSWFTGPAFAPPFLYWIQSINFNSFALTQRIHWINWCDFIQSSHCAPRYPAFRLLYVGLPCPRCLQFQLIEMKTGAGGTSFMLPLH